MAKTKKLEERSKEPGISIAGETRNGSLRSSVAQAVPAVANPLSVYVPTFEDIQKRAFCLWEAAGRPEGDGVEFWLRAESDLAK